MATLLNNTVQKALTTLDRAKSFLGISGDSQDTRLTIMINQITGSIEQFLSRKLLSQVYTNEEYDGTGTDTLVLKQYPVTAFSKLEVNVSGDATASWETIDTSRYFWYEDGRVVLLSPVGGFLDVDAGVFLDQPRKYRATYTAGYEIDFSNENDPAQHTLPPEIEYSCLKLLGGSLNTGKSLGLQSAKVGDVTMVYRKEILGDEELMQMLGKYASATI